MLEIYNEQVRDLLNPSTLKVKGGMKVRQHPKLGFYVDNLLSVPVGSYTDIETKVVQFYRLEEMQYLILCQYVFI